MNPVNNFQLASIHTGPILVLFLEGIITDKEYEQSYTYILDTFDSNRAVPFIRDYINKNFTDPVNTVWTLKKKTIGIITKEKMNEFGK